MAFVNLDGTTVDGTNGDLSDPIRTGLGSLGVACADPTSPADADLAALATADLDQLLDVAEYRCLQSVLGNLDEVNEQAGTDRKDFGQFAAALQVTIAALLTSLQQTYGVGLMAPSIGTLDYNFAESGDPADWAVTPL